jgi:4-aminobutyrate aminotransferase-like enzyme
MDNARQMGDALRLRLAALSARYPQIGDVRGAGLMIGVEIVAADRAPDKTETTRLVNGMRRRGVLISSCGAGHNVLKIRPPLIFQPEHVDIFVAAFEAILSRPETAGPL